MGGKAKPTKHTAKEIAKKVGEATTNKGGGKAGLADRKGGAAGHAKFKCPSCGIQSPSIKSAEMHWDSKHPKLPFVPEDWSDMHAANGGVTTKGVAVRGSGKEKTFHRSPRPTRARRSSKRSRAKKAAVLASRGARGAEPKTVGPSQSDARRDRHRDPSSRRVAS